MYSSVFVIDYKSSINSMVSFAAVCVYCCFCFLYMFWLTVEAVSVYVGEPVVDGCVASSSVFFITGCRFVPSIVSELWRGLYTRAAFFERFLSR